MRTIKILSFIIIAMGLTACQDGTNNTGDVCNDIQIEFAEVGINNSCGPKLDRSRSYYTQGTICLRVTGEALDERSMWLSSDGTLIRMNNTYETVEGWNNVSRDPEYSFWVDFTYLSDEYCSNFEGDVEQCIYEGCAPFDNANRVVYENNECQLDATILCVYNIDGFCTGEYFGMICNKESEDVVLMNAEGYPSGWERCDVLPQCVPSNK